MSAEHPQVPTHGDTGPGHRPTDGSTVPQAGVPQDRPLSYVVDELSDDGMNAQFQPLAGGSVRCLRGGHEFDASRLPADNVGRMEGASDPDDTVMVVPVTCPVCMARGQLILQYGPMASREDSDVMVALDRRPATTPPSQRPPNLA